MSGRVKASVVDAVVVSFREELDRARRLLVDLHHAMHDGNVACVENSTSESGYGGEIAVDGAGRRSFDFHTECCGP